MNDKTNEYPMSAVEKEKKRYDVILQTRDFEIDLLWKRSLFFWGFIASAFAGYVALGEDVTYIALSEDIRYIALDEDMVASVGKKYNELGHFLVTVFGFICSCAWVMVNLGGKHWQENWEEHLYDTEREITGELFGERHPKKQTIPLSFSLSRTTISLSYVTAVIWGILLLNFSKIFSAMHEFLGVWNFSQLKCDISWWKFLGIAVVLIGVVKYMQCKLRSKTIRGIATPTNLKNR